MIRSFIALQPNINICDRLADLGRTVAGARPVPRDQLHLTLRFIGDIDGNLFRMIKQHLQEVSFPSLTLEIMGVGHFPPRGMPRVIWAGVVPPEPILALRTRINAVLAECGLPPEERKFHPHITIARCKTSSVNRIADFLAGNSLLHSPPFPITAFSLFSSRLTAKGAIHRLEAEYPLGNHSS